MELNCLLHKKWSFKRTHLVLESSSCGQNAIGVGWKTKHALKMFVALMLIKLIASIFFYIDLHCLHRFVNEEATTYNGNGCDV